MKNLFILLLFIFVTSCNMDDNFDSINFDKSYVYQKITSSKNIDYQKNAFRTLTNIEKSKLWKYKYELILSSSDLNLAQISFIENLQNLVTDKIFDKNSKESKIFNTIIISDLVEEGKKLFTSVELFDLLFDLNNDNFLLNSIKQTRLQQSVCSCTVGSKYTCGRVIGVGIWGVDIEYGNCSDKNCVTDSGCGGFWSQTCDGSKCTY